MTHNHVRCQLKDFENNSKESFLAVILWHLIVLLHDTGISETVLYFPGTPTIKVR